jgi:hypothetical protein
MFPAARRCTQRLERGNEAIGQFARPGDNPLPTEKIR